MFVMKDINEISNVLYVHKKNINFIRVAIVKALKKLSEMGWV